MMASASLIVALFALSISAFSLWLQWLRSFRLNGQISGILLMPSLREGTPFSLVVSTVLVNRGARGGMITGGYVRLLHSNQEMRLEAIALEDPARVVQWANAPETYQQAEALSAIGAVLSLGSYESKAVGFRCAFPSEDSMRFEMFGPKAAPGEYQVELWCQANDKWCHVGDYDLELRKEDLTVVQVPSVRLSGRRMDTAPGAPLAQDR